MSHRPAGSAAISSAAVTVACLAAAAGILVAQQPQGPPFRGGVNFVLVDAHPTRDGRTVESLTQADFAVTEDGKPQKVESFEFIRIDPAVADGTLHDPNTQEEGNDLAADPHHRVFVVYLDNDHVNLDGSHASRRPLVDFLNGLITPNDLFGVMTSFLRPRDLILGRQTGTIEDQLARNWIWGDQPMSMQGHNLEPEDVALAKCYGWSMDTSSSPLLREAVERRREDRVLQSLQGLMPYLGALREARKNVLVLTRGWMLYRPDQSTVDQIIRTNGDAVPQVGVDLHGRPGLNSTPGRPDLARCNADIRKLFLLDDEQALRELITAANRNNVAFYLLNPAGLEAPDIMGRGVRGSTALATLRGRDSSMRTLAENTDGLAIMTNDLGAGLRRVQDDVSEYYLLGYSSTNATTDGKFRKIEVKVNQPGVKVSARHGYFAPSDAERRAMGSA